VGGVPQTRNRRPFTRSFPCLIRNVPCKRRNRRCFRQNVPSPTCNCRCFIRKIGSPTCNVRCLTQSVACKRWGIGCWRSTTAFRRCTCAFTGVAFRRCPDSSKTKKLRCHSSHRSFFVLSEFILLKEYSSFQFSRVDF